MAKCPCTKCYNQLLTLLKDVEKLVQYDHLDADNLNAPWTEHYEPLPGANMGVPLTLAGDILAMLHDAF